MNIQDVLKNAKNLTRYEIEQKLNKLIRENSRYFNLDKDNKKLVLDLIMKYFDKIYRGLKIDSYLIKDEMYKLWQNRIKLNLTEEDLKDIRELLEEIIKHSK